MLRFVKTPHDLVTASSATQLGFLDQAFRKAKVAESFVKEARTLYMNLQELSDTTNLLTENSLLPQLMTAAGFSDKAKGYFSKDELVEALSDMLARIKGNDPTSWQQEIVYRYLLTCGDALGGSMRNIVGAYAQKKFCNTILENLRHNNVPVKISSSPKGKTQKISWGKRALVFDKRLPAVKKNIDVILLDKHDLTATDKDLLAQHTACLACGEIKGGIDPAGADEHWKTACSSLERIRSTIGKSCPPLFFAAAAIVEAMAEEIFDQLQDGRLTHAANITIQEQLDDLASWLISL